MESVKTKVVAGVSVSRHATRTVLITGGTDGLGRAIADIYRDAGWRVLVVGRKLREGERSRFIGADLSDPLSYRDIVAALDAQGVDALDLLIHNAAAGAGGALEDYSAVQIEMLVTLNVWSPIALTHALLPRVRAARGKVVFIGSVAAFAPAAGYAVYAATKAALDGFARAVAEEMRAEVDVQVIHPGPIRTGFHARAGFAGLDASRFPPPERVAAQVKRMIERGGWRQFVDTRTWMLATVSRLLRSPVDAFAARRSARRAPQPHASASLHTPASSDAPASGGASASQAARSLVTGAASGLGEAIALRLLQRGDAVLGVDRTRVIPQVLADRERFSLHVADLADRDDVSGSAAALQRFGPVDLFVHCAGTSAVGAFGSQSLETLRVVLWTNFVAPMIMTARALQSQELAPGGSIVFVSSLSYFVGYPGAAVYAASKDGLAHFSRGLRIALAARGLNCLTVFPGPMRTPHARRFAPPGASEARRVPPGVVANAVLAAVRCRRAQLVPGFGGRLASVFGSFAPGLSTRILGRTLYRRLAAAPLVLERTDDRV